MERISIGYLFSEDRKYVALISQKFPTGCYLNGIGGHIEIGESSSQAIKREFQEEAGLIISEWKLVCSLYKPNLQVDFYKAFSDIVFSVKTMKEETISVYNIEQIKYLDCHPNLHILIGMCLDDAFEGCDVNLLK